MYNFYTISQDVWCSGCEKTNSPGGWWFKSRKTHFLKIFKKLRKKNNLINKIEIYI